MWAAWCAGGLGYSREEWMEWPQRPEDQYTTQQWVWGRLGPGSIAGSNIV